MTRVMRFRFGVFGMNLLVYGDGFIFECNALWYILYKLIELCLRVAASSDGLLQILQPRFGTSKPNRNWENIGVYFPIIARADNLL